MIKILLIYFLLKTCLIGDFSQEGPFNFTITSSSLSITNQDSIRYTIFEPLNGTSTTSVVLCHGFFRNQTVMSELAQHLSSWGVRSITIDFNNSSVLNNDPMKDVQELKTISDSLIMGQLIYIGHSSGGMRAVISASQNSNVIAVMGLDLVNESDIGSEIYTSSTQSASSLTIPLWGIVGENSSCNNFGNGLQLYSAAQNSNLVYLTDADHCDFEGPTDLLCELLCNGLNPQFSDEEINATIKTLVTAFTLWQVGLDSNAYTLWTPGYDYYDNLIASEAAYQINTLENNQESLLPNHIILKQNYPNPFNPVTSINYFLPLEYDVDISIYDIRGGLIKSILVNQKQMGHNKVIWDGKNFNNEDSSSGMYIVVLKSGGLVKTKKMLYLK